MVQSFINVMQGLTDCQYGRHTTAMKKSRAWCLAVQREHGWGAWPESPLPFKFVARAAIPAILTARLRDVPYCCCSCWRTASWWRCASCSTASSRLCPTSRRARGSCASWASLSLMTSAPDAHMWHLTAAHRHLTAVRQLKTGHCT